MGVETQVTAGGKTTQDFDQSGVSGSVTADGTAMGYAQGSGNQGTASAAVNGRLYGEVDNFGDFAVEGAIHANAGGNIADESGYVQVAANGRADAGGYGASGAAMGGVAGSTKGNYAYYAQWNVCFKLPNSQVVCYYGNVANLGGASFGSSSGSTGGGGGGGGGGSGNGDGKGTQPGLKCGPGFYDKDGKCYGSTPGTDWKETTKPGWYDPGKGPNTEEDASESSASTVSNTGAMAALVASAFVLLF